MSYNAVKSLLSKGVSRPTLYQVVLPVAGETNAQLEFLCKQASVPEVRANTIAVNGHESMGVVREQTTQIVYGNPFTITVISDRDFKVYKEVRSWFETMNLNPFGTGSQKINYYDSYKRQITLHKLEQQNAPRKQINDQFVTSSGLGKVFTVQFNNAFPVSMGEISLSSDAYDTFTEFTINFAYETYDFVDNSLSIFS